MAKILIIDDDPGICEAVSLVLGREGHEVTCASDKDTGRLAVENDKPDLLILDVMMEQPDDGIALAQELRAKGFTRPILMLTSIAHVTGLSYDKDDELVPVDEFQEKPITPAMLREKVTKLLSEQES